MEKRTLVEIQNLYKQFIIDGKQLEVLEDINLAFKEEEFISIVGASGCGKSTILRVIAGLETPSKGSALLDNKEIVQPSINCGMVFQEARLFPWLTVEKNVEFGISKKMTKEQKQATIQKHIDLVGLNGFEKALPRQLSGGMQQRVSIARGLVNNPELLLLDEPFGALDALTKILMQKEVMRIWQAEKKTMILVTHDIDEAIYLSDKVVVLSSRPGKVKGIITIDIARPRDRSSADFTRIKKLIFEKLFDEEKAELEYYI